MEKPTFKKIMLVVAGSTALALAVIGLIVPVLPTIPFLLLAGFCYYRSSKRLHAWLIGHKVFGKYIDNYLTYKGITRKARITSLLLLWIGLSLSAYFVPHLSVRLLLLAVGIGVTTHLLLIKTV